MDQIEVLEKDGYKAKLYHDEFPDDPRGWDNLGTMLCWHKRYLLGDKNPMEKWQFDSWQEIADAIHEGYDPVVMLRIRMYDHSGIGLATGLDTLRYPFNCPWDSGWVGFIFAEREKVLKEWGRKRVSKKLREKVQKILESELETYNQYVQGEVYGIVIEDPDGYEMDSCWGYYGWEYARREAEGWLERVAERMKKDVALHI